MVKDKANAKVSISEKRVIKLFVNFSNKIIKLIKSFYQSPIPKIRAVIFSNANTSNVKQTALDKVYLNFYNAHISFVTMSQL
jgi:hypothetical protein